MTASKIGRNDPCPCGSGKKYKQCCGADAKVAPGGKASHSPDSLNDLAVAELQRGRPLDAERLLREALVMAPNHAIATGNLGNALAETGRRADAIECFLRAVSLKPDHVDALANLGQQYLLMQRFDAAIEHCQKSLALRPDNVNALNTLGAAYYHLKRMDDALAAWGQAQRLAPNNAMITMNLGLLLKDTGRLDEACTWLTRALDLDMPQKDALYSNLFFAMQFGPHTQKEELQALCRRYQADYEATRTSLRRPHTNTREPARRLRIGYVSADLRRHAISFFIEPIIAQHDREQFDVYCYYNGINDDDVTWRLRQSATGFVNCSRLNDEQLAEVIRLQQIDILIDLSGHTAHNRLTLFAHKPAPIQMTYLGYPGSSWLAAMDYLITDTHTDPPGSEDWYSERLLRLPLSHFCYRPPGYAAAVDALPASRNGYVTFASFSNPNKLDDASIALWAALLKRVPDTRLLMRPIPVGKEQQRMRDLFAQHSVDIERLILKPGLPAEQFMNVLTEADIALDPLTVNSPTTMCECLWMGLPTVSLAGARAPARTGRSILAAAGLLEYAADNVAQYLDIAAGLAGDIDALARRRATQRDQIAHSPLRDEQQFTRQLEDGYRRAWAQWCVEN